MDLSPVDLLVFGPHTDDLEIGVGGTIAKQVALGHRVGLCDLTCGELGSNGTPEERVAEADAARAVLGAAWRVNLGLPDGWLAEDAAQIHALADLIRACRPLTIAVPFDGDRHPDHRAASRLVAAAAFKAGLRRYETAHAHWATRSLCAYFINDSIAPSFVVDVSEHYALKQRALACHRTQFKPAGHDATETRLTSPAFARLIESRDAQFGALIGAAYAEGFVVRGPLVRPHLLDPDPVEPT